MFTRALVVLAAVGISGGVAFAEPPAGYPASLALVSAATGEAWVLPWVDARGGYYKAADPAETRYLLAGLSLDGSGDLDLLDHWPTGEVGYRVLTDSAGKPFAMWSGPWMIPPAEAASGLPSVWSVGQAVEDWFSGQLMVVFGCGALISVLALASRGLRKSFER